jgi:glycosyltransferase involved in cell wall biosynthesis
MSSYSIIVRTRNEEKYIQRCLSAIRKQENIKDVEIILIDNASIDSTLSIATPYIDELLTIDKFLPGRALNLGVSRARHEFIVMISGHCIPQSKDWLYELSLPFHKRMNSPREIIGVYGRQIPEFDSKALDKRDLWNTFGEEDRLQVRDVFFHNANSIVRRDTLIKYPFSEKVTNVEDRLWGKEMITNGYALYYASRAIVYHWHGINHAGDESRADKVVKVFEENQIYTIPEPSFGI